MTIDNIACNKWIHHFKTDTSYIFCDVWVTVDLDFFRTVPIIFGRLIVNAYTTIMCSNAFLGVNVRKSNSVKKSA